MVFRAFLLKAAACCGNKMLIVKKKRIVLNLLLKIQCNTYNLHRHLEAIKNNKTFPLRMFPPLFSPAGATMQLVPPSAAVSPGGLCLSQLAAEWNNHAVTPQEQKGPTPFPFRGVLVTQRVAAHNAFSPG